MDCVSAGVGVTVSPFLGCLEIAESEWRGGGQGQGGGWVGGGAVERLGGTSQHSLASGSLRTT